MLREIVHIDEDLCTGCGLCVPACHEGALRIIDEKARLVSDLMCDGLGACLGHCPEDAITIVKEEAKPYDESLVISRMVEKGSNTVMAHLDHLAEHSQEQYLREGLEYLEKNKKTIDFDVEPLLARYRRPQQHQAHHAGCPGSRERTFTPVAVATSGGGEIPSQLQQWPVQMHLVNPAAPWFADADVLLAADCVAYAYGDFHRKWLRDKKLIIACPKLDTRQENYRAKLETLIENSGIRSLTVMIMEVPCCGGLLHMAREILERSARKIPLKALVISVRGEVLAEEELSPVASG